MAFKIGGVEYDFSFTTEGQDKTREEFAKLTTQIKEFRDSLVRTFKDINVDGLIRGDPFSKVRKTAEATTTTFNNIFGKIKEGLVNSVQLDPVQKSINNLVKKFNDLVTKGAAPLGDAIQVNVKDSTLKACIDAASAIGRLQDRYKSYAKELIKIKEEEKKYLIGKAFISSKPGEFDKKEMLQFLKVENSAYKNLEKVWKESTAALNEMKNKLAALKREQQSIKALKSSEEYNKMVSALEANISALEKTSQKTKTYLNLLTEIGNLSKQNIGSIRNYSAETHTFFEVTNTDIADLSNILQKINKVLGTSFTGKNVKGIDVFRQIVEKLSTNMKELTQDAIKMNTSLAEVLSGVTVPPEKAITYWSEVEKIIKETVNEIKKYAAESINIKDVNKLLPEEMMKLAEQIGRVKEGLAANLRMIYNERDILGNLAAARQKLILLAKEGVKVEGSAINLLKKRGTAYKKVYDSVKAQADLISKISKRAWVDEDTKIKLLYEELQLRKAITDMSKSINAAEVRSAIRAEAKVRIDRMRLETEKRISHLMNAQYSQLSNGINVLRNIEGIRDNILKLIHLGIEEDKIATSVYLDNAKVIESVKKEMLNIDTQIGRAKEIGLLTEKKHIDLLQQKISLSENVLNLGILDNEIEKASIANNEKKVKSLQEVKTFLEKELAASKEMLNVQKSIIEDRNKISKLSEIELSINSKMTDVIKYLTGRSLQKVLHEKEARDLLKTQLSLMKDYVALGGSVNKEFAKMKNTIPKNLVGGTTLQEWIPYLEAIVSMMDTVINRDQRIAKLKKELASYLELQSSIQEKINNSSKRLITEEYNLLNVRRQIFSISKQLLETGVKSNEVVAKGFGNLGKIHASTKAELDVAEKKLALERSEQEITTKITALYKDRIRINQLLSKAQDWSTEKLKSQEATLKQIEAELYNQLKLYEKMGGSLEKQVAGYKRESAQFGNILQELELKKLLTEKVASLQEKQKNSLNAIRSYLEAIASKEKELESVARNRESIDQSKIEALKLELTLLREATVEEIDRFSAAKGDLNLRVTENETLKMISNSMKSILGVSKATLDIEQKKSETFATINKSYLEYERSLRKTTGSTEASYQAIVQQRKELLKMLETYMKLGGEMEQTVGVLNGEKVTLNEIYTQLHRQDALTTNIAKDWEKVKVTFAKYAGDLSNARKAAENLYKSMHPKDFVQLFQTIKSLTSISDVRLFQALGKQAASKIKDLTRFRTEMERIVFLAEKKARKEAGATIFDVARMSWFVQLRMFWTMYMNIMTVAADITKIGQDIERLGAITGATTEQILEMKKAIFSLADIPTVLTGISEAAIKIGQAGFSAQEVVKIIKPAAELAAIVKANMTDVGDIITTVIRAWNMSADEATVIADKLATAITKSKVSIEGLKTVFTYISAIAPQVNMTLDDVLGAVAVLTNAGMSMSKVGTSMRAFLTSLLAPSSKFIKELQRVGLTVQDISPEFNSLADILAKLRDSGFSALSAFKALDRRSAAGIALLIEYNSEYERYSKIMHQVGIVQEMLQSQSAELGNIFIVVKNKVLKFADSVKGVIEDPLGGFLQLIGDLADGIGYLLKQFPLLGKIAGYAGQFLVFGMAIMAIKKGITMLSTAIGVNFIGSIQAAVASLQIQEAEILNNTASLAYLNTEMAATTAQEGALAAETAVTSGALATMKAVIGALGWPMLIAGTVTAISAFLTFRKETSKTSKELEKLKEMQSKLTNAITDHVNAVHILEKAELNYARARDAGAKGDLKRQVMYVERFREELKKLSEFKPIEFADLSNMENVDTWLGRLQTKVKMAKSDVEGLSKSVELLSNRLSKLALEEFRSKLENVISPGTIKTIGKSYLKLLWEIIKPSGKLKNVMISNFEDAISGLNTLATDLEKMSGRTKEVAQKELQSALVSLSERAVDISKLGIGKDFKDKITKEYSNLGKFILQALYTVEDKVSKDKISLLATKIFGFSEEDIEAIKTSMKAQSDKIVSISKEVWDAAYTEFKSSIKGIKTKQKAEEFGIIDPNASRLAGEEFVNALAYIASSAKKYSSQIEGELPIDFIENLTNVTQKAYEALNKFTKGMGATDKMVLFSQTADLLADYLSQVKEGLIDVHKLMYKFLKKPIQEALNLVKPKALDSIAVLNQKLEESKNILNTLKNINATSGTEFQTALQNILKTQTMIARKSMSLSKVQELSASKIMDITKNLLNDVDNIFSTIDVKTKEVEAAYYNAKKYVLGEAEKILVSYRNKAITEESRIANAIEKIDNRLFRARQTAENELFQLKLDRLDEVYKDEELQIERAKKEKSKGWQIFREISTKIFEAQTEQELKAIKDKIQLAKTYARAATGVEEEKHDARRLLEKLIKAQLAIEERSAEIEKRKWEEAKNRVKDINRYLEDIHKRVKSITMDISDGLSNAAKKFGNTLLEAMSKVSVGNLTTNLKKVMEYRSKLEGTKKETPLKAEEKIVDTGTISTFQKIGDSLKKTSEYYMHGTDVFKESVKQQKEIVSQEYENMSSITNLNRGILVAASDIKKSAEETGDKIKAKVEEGGKNAGQLLKDSIEGGIKEGATKLKRVLDDMFIKFRRTTPEKNAPTATATLRGQTGFVIPGYGGGDKVLSLLEKGEGVINKEGVRAIGESFINYINTMRFRMTPQPVAATTSGKVVNINLAIGDSVYPLQGTEDIVEALERDLEKKKLIRRR